MMKSCHDWFPCCHDSVPRINLDLSSSSTSAAPCCLSFFFFLDFPFSLWLCAAPRAHLKYLNAVGRRLWSASGALAQADVWISTDSEMNAKNVQAVSGRRSAAVFRTQSRGGETFFAEKFQQSTFWRYNPQLDWAQHWRLRRISMNFFTL